MNAPMRVTLAALAALISLPMLANCRSDETAPASLTQDDLCPIGPPIETDGLRRVALIVGIGQYLSDKVNDLPGPPQDARRVYELLTRQGGWGFPKQNVCLLLDDQATTGGFREKFQKVLLDRVREGDVAVVYYAGHGSRAHDTNGDEPDEWDETFLFQDARTPGVGDMLDDEFNTLLASLHRKTHDITVILDSCNSGTATRGAEASPFLARFMEPAADQSPQSETASGDEGQGWAPETMPGLVVLTAASDGTSALERDGRGVFTDALLTVLDTAPEQGLTYAQLARRVPPLVSANSYQIPYFQGDLGSTVFHASGGHRPAGWDVTAVGPPLELSGPPLPGIGLGAELRVYDGSVTGTDTEDPAKAKATVVVDQLSGLNATAAVSEVADGAAPIEVGDLAILVRPGDDFLRVSVRLRPASEPGGLPSARAEEVRQLIDHNPESRILVNPTDGPGEYELFIGDDSKLQLLGPEGSVRMVYERDDLVPQNLWQHARQKALLRLHGEGGDDFTDQETLLVRAVPAKRQHQCADPANWRQAGPNSTQIIPLCHEWNLNVALSDKSPTPLLIGGVVLSTDGSIFGFPVDNRTTLLKPGENVTFDAPQETYSGLPPLNIEDHVLVFGTKETNPVRWTDLTSPVKKRGAPMSALHRALDRYLEPGTRGVGRTQEVENSTWTMSMMSVRTEANVRFLEPRDPNSPIDKREYTIANFDLRPYLPDNHASALYKVLQLADKLARASKTDGIPYKQHPWDQPDDQANLAKGIDCSRAIWYVFTRSGLRYNQHDDAYMTTAGMASRSGPMSDEFDVCDGSMRLGDVLVYRDDTRGDGHVVMAIDPQKRIAWGSHGWDGEGARNPAIEPDTGVEYQLIKFKQDWERWDRRTMHLKVCWRYRQFSREYTATRGVTGTEALSTPCDERACR